MLARSWLTPLLLPLAVVLVSCGDDPSAGQLTYAPTSSSWCADLGLAAAVDDTGLGPVVARDPVHTATDDGTSDTCTVDSEPESLTIDGGGADRVTVQVEAVVHTDGTTPDLADERGLYSEPNDLEQDPDTTDISGWWSDGVAGTAEVLDRGEVNGYRSGASVVRDNVEVTVSVLVVRAEPSTYADDVDDLRDELLRLVDSRLEKG